MQLVAKAATARWEEELRVEARQRGLARKFATRWRARVVAGGPRLRSALAHIHQIEWPLECRPGRAGRAAGGARVRRRHMHVRERRDAGRRYRRWQPMSWPGSQQYAGWHLSGGRCGSRQPVGYRRVRSGHWDRHLVHGCVHRRGGLRRGVWLQHQEPTRSMAGGRVACELTSRFTSRRAHRLPGARRRHRQRRVQASDAN